MRRCVLTVLLALAALPASAVEPVVGGYVGTLVLGPDHELYAPMSGKHLDQPLTVSIGARAGLALTEWFDIEGELEIGAWPVAGGTATIAGMRVGPRFTATDVIGQGGDLHMTAGVGNLAVMAPDRLSGTDVDFAAHIGPGGSFDLGKRVAIRADYRLLVTSHRGESTHPSLQSLFTVGASVRLGASSSDNAGYEPISEPMPVVEFIEPEPIVEVSEPEPVVEVIEPEPISEPEPVVKVSEPEPVAPLPSVVDAQIAVIAQSILFEAGSWDLQSVSMTHIEELAGLLHDSDGFSVVRIEGYTDSTGAEASNLRLSQARVDEVSRVLVSLGIDADKLVAQGFGEANPVADNSTPEGRAANRRVEIHVE